MDNTYYLTGNIDDNSVRDLMRWFAVQKPKYTDETLKLVISSKGGNVSNSLAFVDIAMPSRVKLITYAVGEVSSMAIPIFMVGSHRVISENATMYFHELGRTFSESTRLKTTEIRQVLDRLYKSELIYADFISSRTNGRTTRENVFGYMRSEETIGATMAIQLGLAHATLDSQNSPF